MTITILAFGRAKEIFDSAAIGFETADALSVGGLKALLETKYAALKRIGDYRIAVNNEFGSADTIINASDEIAILPPVSGG